MGRRHNLLAAFLLLSSALHAGNFVVLGDSLSDTGNLARFTYNSGAIYNENLANYFGEEFPVPDGGSSTLIGGAFGIRPPSLKGPNYAQGGATANEDLGMGRTFFSGGFIKFQTAKQIDNFLSNPANGKLEDKKVVYWIGGNDMRLASEVIHKYPIAENEIVNKSISDIGNQLRKLAANDVSFIVVPDVPDIAYTPKFFRQFAEKTTLGGRKLFVEKKWTNFWRGISVEELDDLLDLPQGKKQEEVIKTAIRELLKKQNIEDEQQVEEWFAKYKEERDLVSALGKHFNSGVDQELEKIKQENPQLTFLRPRTSSMILEVVDSPEDYGFTNATGAAAKTFSSAVANIKQWGAGSGRDRIAAFDPEDGVEGVANLDKKHLWNRGYHYVFADEFHPSPEAHRIISDYMISLMESKNGDTSLKTLPHLRTENKDQTRVADAKMGEIKSGQSEGTLKKGYVPYGVFRARQGGKIAWDNAKLENTGIVAYADGANSSIALSRYAIKNIGRINSAILVENAGEVILKDGSLESTRGSKISYPFGARVNGRYSKLLLERSTVTMNGEGSVGVSIGNEGKGEFLSSRVESNGKDGKALHLWNGTVEAKNSTFHAKEGVGAWIFANDKNRNISTLSMEGSKIEGKDYAIEVASNVTKIPAHANIYMKNTEILGGIHTEANSISNLQMEHSLWKMKRSSSVSNLAMQDSNLHFSSDQWQTLTVGNYSSQNSTLFMKGQLAGDDSPTDKLIINGTVSGMTGIQYRNIGGTGALTNYGIKIIDLKHETSRDAFRLLSPVYAGDYEYSLMMGGNNGVKEDFYLTSNLVENNGRLSVPVRRSLSEATMEIENTPVLEAREISLESPSLAVASLTTEEQPVLDRAFFRSARIERAPEKPVVSALAEEVLEKEEATPVVATATATEATPVLVAEEVKPVVEEVTPVVATATEATPVLASEEAETSLEPAPEETVTRRAVVASLATPLEAAPTKRIFLFRPKVMVARMLPHVNMEHSFLNIWHLRDRRQVDFSMLNNHKTLKENENRTEITSESSVYKLSYPLTEKAGIVFSIGEGNSTLKDHTRTLFHKETEVGKVKTKEMDIGIYYQHSFLGKVNFDHTFQFQRIKNVYETEGNTQKSYGNGFAYSAYMEAPIPLYSSLEFIPSYQVDYVRHYFSNNHNYALRQHIGMELGWKQSIFSLQTGVKYQDDIRRLKSDYRYQQDGFLYSVNLEMSPTESFRFYGNASWNPEKKNRSYEFGVKYKF